MICMLLLLIAFYLYIVSNRFLAFDPVNYFEHSNTIHITSSNPPSVGGIHGCVRFSTKYEARHVIPWLHYHKRLGFSHFHLYFDSKSSNLSNPLEGKVFEFISALPYVTIYDQYAVGLNTEYLVLNHCVTLSHIQKKGDWVIEFDIDEVFSFNERLTEKPNCAEGEYDAPAGALSTFVSNVPPNILAIVIPRIEFRTSGVDIPPENHGQMELYIHRHKDFSHAAKVLYRANSTGVEKIKLRSKHDVWTTVIDSVSYPCGENIHRTECDSDGYCYYNFNLTQIPQEFHLKAPFLYHYVTRSSQECHLKLKDLPSDNWRVINAQSVCAETTGNSEMVFDYGVHCSGKAVTRELASLNPSYNEPPYIF